MSNAVYITASLPFLKFGDPPPFPISELRNRCSAVMTEEELATFDSLVNGEECDDPFASAYMAHEIQLKNVVGHARAASWGPEVRFSERQFPGYDVTFAKMVSEAYAKQNPLEREQELDKTRFWLVDELARGEDSMAAVYAFVIKLKICERWSRISAEAGNAAVLKVINDNDPAYNRDDRRS